MKNNDYRKAQVIISLVIVLMLTILIVALAVIGGEVKAEVKSELSKLELPDFSSIDSMMVKADRVIALIDKLPFDKVKDFTGVWSRLDAANATKAMIDILPLFKDFLLNEINNTVVE